jgi:hypothetical protein
MDTSIDWGRLEEVVERAVRRARSEELRDVAEAIKTLADYVKKGFDIIAEQNKIIAEHSKRLEEHSKILAEHSKRLEELSKRVEELSKRIEEHSKILAEHSKRIEESAKEVRDLRRTVTVIAHRFGVLSEEGFRDAMRYVVEEVFGVAKVERWVYNDVEGFVYGIPSIVEVNLLIKDKKHILLEVKSRVSRGDVMELHKIRELYEKITGIKPMSAIMGGLIDRGAKELAEKLGVEIIPIT